jgi:large subunit ribosomal protein L25
LKQKKDIAFDIKIDGNVKKVVIQEYQSHPVTSNLLHVDLMIVQDGARATYKVPVTIEGTPIGLKNKGLLAYHRKRVEVKAQYKDLPKSFHFDVSNLDTGNNFLVRDLELPTGVECYLDPRVPIVGVIKAK